MGTTGGRYRTPADVNGRTSGAVRRARAAAALAAKRAANMERPARFGRCARCAEPLPATIGPQRQRYCTRACKQAAYRDR